MSIHDLINIIVVWSSSHLEKKTLGRWRRTSETDVFKNIWSPKLDIVFEGSSLVLVG